MRIRFVGNTRVLAASRSGNAVQQAVWVWLATVPLFLLSIPQPPWIFGAERPTQNIVRQEVIYFRCWRSARGERHYRSAIVLLHGARFDGDCDALTALGRFWIFHSNNVHLWRVFWISAAGDWRAALTTAISNWSTVLMFWLLMRDRRSGRSFGLDDHHFRLGIVSPADSVGLPRRLPQLVESVGVFHAHDFFARQRVAGAATSIALTIKQWRLCR